MGKKMLPLVLGLLTAGLIALALWPSEPPQKTVVVAARDLGAGTVLAAGDLTVRTMPAQEAPADALADPAPLVGKTLAVPRFRGETVTLRHIGPPVTLQPYERGVAVKVALDTGLAGLLRPGMHVSVAGVLDDGTSTQVKVALEHLRVLYVSPDFQARPATPAVARMTVGGGKTDLLTGGAATYQTAAQQAREGVVILAVPITATAVTYTPIVTTAVTTTLSLDTALDLGIAARMMETEPLTVTQPMTTTPTMTVTTPVGYYAVLDARRVWVNPVELLAALNAKGDALTLILEPQENVHPLFSPGVVLEDLAVRRPEEVGP